MSGFLRDSPLTAIGPIGGIGWKRDIVNWPLPFVDLPHERLRYLLAEPPSVWAAHCAHPTRRPAGALDQIPLTPPVEGYAETLEEQSTVLARANALASRVLGEGSDCWLIQADPDFEAATGDPEPHESITELGLLLDFEHRDAEDECTYRIYSKPVTWIAGTFNELISMRADNRLPVPTMWVSARNGVGFAPYDGGSDLFLGSADEVAELKRDFSTWLSEHPSGL